MRRDIHMQRTYPHPPEAVWRAFATSGALAQWLMPNTFEPRVGHRFEFRTTPAPGFDGVVRCEVLEVDPPRRLAFTWAGGSIDTTVRFELIPEGGGTRVALTHSGFAGVRGVLLSHMLGNGWSGMLDRKLPAAVAALSGGGGAPASVPGCDGDTSRFWRLFNRAFRRSPVVAVLAVLALPAGHARAIADVNDTPLKRIVTTMYEPMAENLLATATMMPTELYEFRAASEVRSFGQMIGHVAGSQFLYCSAAAGERLEPALFARLGRVRPYADGQTPAAYAGSVIPKTELVALLRDGVEYCRAAQARLVEPSLLEPVTFGGRAMPRVQAFFENVAHNNEHYGNLVAYLRLQHLVPPSTAVQQKR